MENEKTINGYIYEKESIEKVMGLLQKIKVEGIEQAQILVEVSRLICSPTAEGSFQINNENADN